MHFRFRFGAVAVGSRFLLSGICLLSSVWMQMAPFRPCFVDALFAASVIVLGVVFIVNLCLVFTRQRGVMNFVGLATIICCAVGVLIILKGEPSELRWFRNGGFLKYDRMVQNILLQRSFLSLTNRSLEAITGEALVFGRTNLDGTVEICFQGQGNCKRDGYLYYNGKGMVQSADNTNVFYFPWAPASYYLHVTNNWYAYY